MSPRFNLYKEPEKLHGIVPPILTPMTADEQIDAASMKKLVNYLIDNGVHGIWIMGTTGEFASFDEKERALAVAAAIEAADGRVPTVVNIGDCSTRLAIRHGKHALSQGADAIALTPPYYYPNSQEELLIHFRKVREAVDLPLMIYNIPQTVKTKTEVATALKLAEEKTVIGIKDSQNDLDWFRQVTVGVKQRGLNFRSFLGTRFLIDAATIIGAAGSIPSIANITPKACVGAYEASRKGEWEDSRKNQERVMQVARVGGVGVGGCANANLFSAMKNLLVRQGVIANAAVSSPLRPLNEAELRKLEQLAAEIGLGEGY